MLIKYFLYYYFRLSFFDMDYHDNIEEAEEVKPIKQNIVENDKQDEKLLDIEYETKDMLGLEELNLNSSSSNNRIMQSISEVEQKENLEQLFKNLILDNSVSHTDTQEGTQSEFDKKFGEQNLTMDIFDKSDTNFNLADFSSLEEQNSGESLQSLTSENMVLLNDILIDKQNTDSEWEAISNDTFLPSNILKQSLGDAALGIGQKNMLTTTTNMDDKVCKVLLILLNIVLNTIIVN